MKNRNHKYALLLVIAVAATSTGVLSTAYAQQVTDGMDGYTKGGTGIDTGNPAECWYETEPGSGAFAPCMIDTGDTAWMLTATTLVLFMTRGVAFFYGGLARSKNMVNVLGMTLVVMGLISVQWVLWGYSLAFGPVNNDANLFLGSLDYAGFNKVSHVAPLGSPSACTDLVYYTLRSPYVVSTDVATRTDRHQPNPVRSPAPVTPYRGRPVYHTGPYHCPDCPGIED